MNALPRTVDEYLQALRDALRGADPALIQDALYDAEDYLRSELAERAGVDEASVLAEVASSYGAPAEVAAIYTDREQQVEFALHARPHAGRPALTAAAASGPSRAATTPVPPPWYARFFGVALDPRTYGALFYMLLALPLGVFYFSWVVAGVSLSLGLAILIIGIPFMILFVATIYVLSLVEGRLVETLLGERMPRRPAPAPLPAPLLQRIGRLLTDARTWSTLLYMLLMLPLGIAYFAAAVTLLGLSVGLFAGAFMHVLHALGLLAGQFHSDLPLVLVPLVALLGVGLFFVTLHLVRGVGKVHGTIAKSMLVKLARE
jgi:hypothetical protein